MHQNPSKSSSSQDTPVNRTMVLGVDVSKDTLACTLLDAQSRKIVWEGSVPNTKTGINKLLCKAPADAPWVAEPTGRYSRLLVEQATHAGRQVLLAPPRKAKNFLKSLQSRAKTDRLDSYGLALFSLSQSLAPYQLKSEAVEQLDQLLSARRGIADAISRLRLQHQQLSHAAVPLQQAIKALKQQLLTLDRQIRVLTRTTPEFAMVQTLQQVPGIGPVTAAAMTSRLKGKQFDTPDQFVAYVGLDIGVAESGKRKGERGLTRQGDAGLRHLLFLCAQATLRAKNPVFRAQYERELAKGLSTTAAVCAVARKLAKLCWSLVQHGTSFDPERVYHQAGNTVGS